MANKINIGNVNIGSVKLGTADVSLYLGDNKVYPIQTDPPLFSIKYGSGQTYNSEYVCDDNPYKDFISVHDILDAGIAKTAVTEVELSSCIEGIESWTFKGCSNLTGITMPNVTDIGGGAFYGCSNLTGITMPNVTDIGTYAFNGCSNLSGVTIPNVEIIGDSAFKRCSNLTGITIPSSINTIEESAFDDSGLRNVTIQNSSTLTIGRSVFEICSNLTGFTFGSGTTYISGSDYSDGIFKDCRSLSSITIPNNVMSMGGGMFAKCTSLESVNIGSGITEIGNSSFYGCDRLSFLNSNINEICNIPSGITDIGIAAFNSCSRFSELYIPSAVTRIGEGAFDYCYGLYDVYIYATTPPTIYSDGQATDPKIFRDCHNLNAIYVPAASVNAYKTANVWSQYESLIQPIPNN